MGDIRLMEVGLEVLGSYHPFWLKLAMEVVVGKPVYITSKNLRRQIAEMEDFITEHFLNDAELAYEWAVNKAIDGLYSQAYWVRSIGHLLVKKDWTAQFLAANVDPSSCTIRHLARHLELYNVHLDS